MHHNLLSLTQMFHTSLHGRNFHSDVRIRFRCANQIQIQSLLINKQHLTDDDIQVEDQPYADDDSPTAKSPGHIADSESMEKDSIDYPDEPEDGDEDPEEDHTDDPADGEDGDNEPSDDDDDDDTNDEDEEPIEDKEEEEHLALAESSAVPFVDPVPSAEDIETFETDESAPTPRSPQTRVPFS
ncbi:hypothetical protein Tco_1443907 [Tanacetum coccineum]